MTETLLDVTGLSCPLPLLKTKLALKTMRKGDCLNVITSDSGSYRDIPAYIEQSEHALISKASKGGSYYFVIRC